MRDTLRISDVRFVPAPPPLRSSGLMGWATVAVNREFDFGYIAVRRTLDGRLVLAFPERRDNVGRTHAIVRPLGQAVRDAVTEQVIAELRRQKVIP